MKSKFIILKICLILLITSCSKSEYSDTSFDTQTKSLQPVNMDSIILSHVSLSNMQYSLQLSKQDAISLGVSEEYFDEIYQKMTDLNQVIIEKFQNGESISCQIKELGTIEPIAMTKVVDDEQIFLGTWDAYYNPQQPFQPYTFIYLNAPEKVSACASGGTLFWHVTLKMTNSPYSSHTFTDAYPGLSGIHYFENREALSYPSNRDTHSWTFESHAEKNDRCTITLLRGWYSN